MFTAEEKELILYSLSMRKNVIETGDHNHSAIDAERIQKANSKYPSLAASRPKVRALSVDQMKLIITIDGLMTKILHS
jgi:hypothetical protein